MPKISYNLQKNDVKYIINILSNLELRIKKYNQIVPFCDEYLILSERIISFLDHCKKYVTIFNTVLSFVNDVTYSGRAAHAIAFSVVRV